MEGVDTPGGRNVTCGHAGLSFRILDDDGGQHGEHDQNDAGEIKVPRRTFRWLDRTRGDKGREAESEGGNREREQNQEIDGAPMSLALKPPRGEEGDAQGKARRGGGTETFD